MPAAAGARAAEVHLARLVLRQLDELRHGLRRHRSADNEIERIVQQHAQRAKVLLRVVRLLRLQHGRDHLARVGAEHQRVAVRFGGGDAAGPDDAGRAGLVLDDERLAERSLQLLGDHARVGVGRAARCERHHDAHRPVRIAVGGIGLRKRGRSERKQEERQAGFGALASLQRRAATLFLRALPPVSSIGEARPPQ